MWLTSAIFSAAHAQPAEAPVVQARTLYAEGRAVTAREGLIRWLSAAGSSDPAGRLTAYETLLDICLASYADDCLTANIEGYLAAAKAAPVANSTLGAERVRAVAYYLFAARLAFGRSEVTAAILTDPAWADENVFNGELYLRRQLLSAMTMLFSTLSL